MQRIIFEASPISETYMSGIGHMTLELMRALDIHPDNGKKFKVIAAISYDKKKLVDRWGFKNIEVKSIIIPMRIFNILWKFDFLFPMDLLLGKGSYIFPNYKNWRLIRSKSYTFVCDVSYLLYPEFVSPKNQQFLAKNINKWIKRSYKVFTISQNSAKEIEENLNVDSEKVIIVPCGVDTNTFNPKSNQEVQKLKKNLGISGEYLFYLGNIEPRKNINGLLEAYKLLPETIRSNYAMLIVGGGGWLNEPILDKILELQENGYNIIKPDYRVSDEQLPILFSGASMLVHPAFYEGFGISPLQAMACGTPVVVANNSSLPEVVGDAALLVNAEDVRDISDKMRRLLEDKNLSNTLVKKGLVRVKQFNWKRSAEVLINEIMKED